MVTCINSSNMIYNVSSFDIRVSHSLLKWRESRTGRPFIVILSRCMRRTIHTPTFSYFVILISGFVFCNSPRTFVPGWTGGGQELLRRCVCVCVILPQRLVAIPLHGLLLWSLTPTSYHNLFLWPLVSFNYVLLFVAQRYFAHFEAEHHEWEPSHDSPGSSEPHEAIFKDQESTGSRIDGRWSRALFENRGERSI